MLGSSNSLTEQASRSLEVLEVAVGTHHLNSRQARGQGQSRRVRLTRENNWFLCCLRAEADAQIELFFTS